MRALIDATAMPPQALGAGHYITHLITALGSHREAVDLHVMSKPLNADQLRRAAAVHTADVRSRPARLVWERTILPFRAYRLAPDVFHGPHYTLPPALRCPAVVTFHDPTFFTMPRVHERSKVVFFTRAARSGISRSRRVIAVSRYAAEGAVRYAGADPEAVDVIHLGVDHVLFRPQADEMDSKLRARAGVSGPYLLWVGAQEPRKDVPTLVGAFGRVVSQGADHQLVLVGPPAWGADAISSAVERSGLSDRILRTGYVDVQTKAALYRGASAFVFPSLAEGFGLPVLEAMACGCPVVTTTGSACEEVGGDAVLTVPPADPGSLAEAVGTLLSDEAVAGRLREAGRARADGFTWETTADLTLASYRRATA